MGENGPIRYRYNNANTATARNNRLLFIDYMYGDARKNGIIPIYWEQGGEPAYHSESAAYGDFGLINRTNGQPNSTESRTVIERMIAVANNTSPNGTPTEINAVITWDTGFADTENGSSITVSTSDGLNISGYASGWGAGVYGTPDNSTLSAIRSMKSFSFDVFGDGNSYRVMLPTTQTDSSGDHFGKIFQTTNSVTTTITVNINELTQSGSGIIFSQNNVHGLQFFVSTSAFNLKISNIKINQ